VADVAGGEIKADVDDDKARSISLPAGTVLAYQVVELSVSDKGMQTTHIYSIYYILYIYHPHLLYIHFLYISNKFDKTCIYCVLFLQDSELSPLFVRVYTKYTTPNEIFLAIMKYVHHILIAVAIWRHVW